MGPKVFAVLIQMAPVPFACRAGLRAWSLGGVRLCRSRNGPGMARGRASGMKGPPPCADSLGQLPFVDHRKALERTQPAGVFGGKIKNDKHGLMGLDREALDVIRELAEMGIVVAA